jgi:uncharacterized DUF497 family protein
VRKHGVGFGEATAVFDDPLSVRIGDPDHSTDEQRFLLLGLSNRRRSSSSLIRNAASRSG